MDTFFVECVTGSIYSMFGGLMQSTLGEYEKLSQNNGVACQTWGRSGKGKWYLQKNFPIWNNFMLVIAGF